MSGWRRRMQAELNDNTRDLERLTAKQQEITRAIHRLQQRNDDISNQLEGR